MDRQKKSEKLETNLLVLHKLCVPYVKKNGAYPLVVPEDMEMAFAPKEREMLAQLVRAEKAYRQKDERCSKIAIGPDTSMSEQESLIKKRIKYIMAQRHVLEAISVYYRAKMAVMRKYMKTLEYQEKYADTITNITKEVCRLDDYANSNHPIAFELYSDGGIRMTSGGVLYRQRRLFIYMASTVLPKGFVFPRKCNKRTMTYAILLKKDAVRLREDMIKCVVDVFTPPEGKELVGIRTNVTANRKRSLESIDENAQCVVVKEGEPPFKR